MPARTIAQKPSNVLQGPRPQASKDVTDRAARLRKAALAADALGLLLLELAADVEAGRAEDDPRLSVAEAAAELRCSETHIKSACARRLIAATKIGGWTMRRSALLDYERRITTGGAA
jgi:hypothetical protein